MQKILTFFFSFKKNISILDFVCNRRPNKYLINDLIKLMML